MSTSPLAKTFFRLQSCLHEIAYDYFDEEVIQLTKYIRDHVKNLPLDKPENHKLIELNNSIADLLSERVYNEVACN